MSPLRWHLLASSILALIGALRIAATYDVFSHTIDEPDNLAAGLEYLSTGRYLYHDENPPLARVFAAFGPWVAGERFHPGPAAHLEGVRVLGEGSHYDRVLALARAGILPFFLAASAVVFLWGFRAGGPAAGTGATALFTTLPPVLGLSGIANTDMALCATVPAAALATIYWVEKPSRARSIGLGILVGLACVSKFTAMPFLAAVWALLLLFRPRSGAAGRGRAILLVVATAAIAIWAVYGFTFARVAFLHARLPAPRFFTGIEAVWAHQARGHPSYLMGARSESGFWYYYPVVLAIKVPLGFWALAVAAGVVLWRQRRRNAAAAALALAVAIVLAAMASKVNIGVRYVLPALAGFAVAGGWLMAQARGTAARIAVAAALAWQVVSGALQHPDYLAYTNEIAGASPERFVADSDLDWGQDMKRLDDFLARQGARQVTFTPFNATYRLRVPAQPASPDAPSPGWNAVSVTLWKVFGNPPWADRMPAPRRVGRGILVWRVD